MRIACIGNINGLEGESMKKYFLNVLMSVDQAFLAVLGGDPDDTFSSCAWKLYERKNVYWPVRVIDAFFGKGHCEQAVERDEGKNAIWKWMQ
jgi:hypothetical protein